MTDHTNELTPALLEVLNELNAGQGLPAGIGLGADEAISVTVEVLQVGMKPRGLFKQPVGSDLSDCTIAHVATGGLSGS